MKLPSVSLKLYATSDLRPAPLTPLFASTITPLGSITPFITSGFIASTLAVT